MTERPVELNAPSDELLAIAVNMRRWVNNKFEDAKEKAQRWTLRTCPEDF